ncbi:MAG: PD-(D/E)XK nuclease family protein [Myxococcota bacterium]|nr:PD-(D/E)XK nuclease family protein [Myxococcota bacterium]
MSWWNALVEELTQSVRRDPFGARAVLAPSAFARRSLRAELATALGHRSLPLAGVTVCSIQEVPELFPIRGQIRSRQQLRLELLQAFGRTHHLLGARAQGAWRDQLRLATTLLDADLESIDAHTLTEHFAARPRLLRFLELIQEATERCPGRSKLDAAEAAATPETACWALPLPPVSYRLQALVDRLHPERLPLTAPIHADQLTARTPDQLAAHAVSLLKRSSAQRVALVLLDESLRAPMSRHLLATAMPFASPQKIGAGFSPALRALTKLAFADSGEVDDVASWRNQLPEQIGADVLEAADELCSYSPLQLAGGAFVDELAKRLSRTLPAAGWPQARVHLIEPQAWPDSAYDQVLLLGAQRGRLAQALGAPVPLLSPYDRTLLRQVGLDLFDPELMLERQRHWLKAWQAAGDTVSVGWMTHDASGRNLAPDRWARTLGAQCSASQAPPQTNPRLTARTPPSDPWQVEQPARWSPSRVSALMRCPRQALLERFLKLKGPELELGAEQYSDPQWTGNMLHRIVERALGPICGQPDALSSIPERLDRACWAELRREVPPLTPELIELHFETLKLRLGGLTDFLISGPVRQVLAVERDLPEGSVHSPLHARCDLILEDHRGERMLIDLKSGGAKSSSEVREQERSGKNLQRGAYLLADPTASEAALYFLSGGADALQSVDRSGDQMALAKEALRRAHQHVEAGAFPIAKQGQDAPCSTCAVRAACRRFDASWHEQIAQRAPQFDGTIGQTVRRAESS